MHLKRVGVSLLWTLFLPVGFAMGGGGSAYGVGTADAGVQASESISVTVLHAVTTECHDSFTPPKTTAFDACSGDLTDRIVVTGAVDANTLGVYTLSYTVADDAGNVTNATREITVADTQPPVIQILGRANASVLLGHEYADAGATATDACAGDLTTRIVTEDTVNPAVVGVYAVTYDVEDGNGNSAQAVRKVSVVTKDVTPPEISNTVPDKTLAADASCSAPAPDLTGEVTATDDLTATKDLVISQEPAAGSLLKGLGAHMISLTVKDEAGNATTGTATVHVAAFDHGASAPTAVPWATNGLVNAIVAAGDALYIGGEFTWAGASDAGSGEGWTNLAKIDSTTGAVMDWKPVVGAVHALALSEDGTTLYVGGDRAVESVSLATGASEKVTTAGGTIAALAVADGLLYLGGKFTDGASTDYYLGAFDLKANAMLDWTATVAGPVFSLAVSGTTLYVGEANGVETVDIAADGRGDVALFTTSNGPVNALVVTCETVYAGGGFTDIGGQTGSGVAALDLSGAAKSAWAPVADKPVNALVLTNAGLFATGEFTSVEAVALPGIVQFKDASDSEAAAPTALAMLPYEGVEGLVKDCVISGGMGRASLPAMSGAGPPGYRSGYG